MKEFVFVANTNDGEKRIIFFSVLALALPALVMVAIWKFLLPSLAAYPIFLWLLIVLPSFICCSVVTRRMMCEHVGTFLLRLDKRHLTVVFPDHTVRDLGGVCQADYRCEGEKRADLHIIGTKDQVDIALRAATRWCGRSEKKDFIEAAHAAEAIAAVIREDAAQ